MSRSYPRSFAGVSMGSEPESRMCQPEPEGGFESRRIRGGAVRFSHQVDLIPREQCPQQRVGVLLPATTPIVWSEKSEIRRDVICGPLLSVGRHGLLDRLTHTASHGAQAPASRDIS